MTVRQQMTAPIGSSAAPGSARKWFQTASPRVRKLVLTVHVGASVGWLGSIAAYIAVTLVAITGNDPERVRVCYLVMQELAWFVVLPLDLVSLASGVVLGLITKWGLLRHYWVAGKLALNALATAVLILYTFEIGYYQRMAAARPLPAADMRTLQGADSLLHSVAGFVVVLAALVLAVWKPRGLTRYRARRAAHPRPDVNANRG